MPFGEIPASAGDFVANRTATRYLERVSRFDLLRQPKAPARAEFGDKGGEVPASPHAAANPSSARLLATQIAAVGSTRLKIEERPRSKFGVADADAILAQVFGAKG